jgi:YfiH family protein
MDRPIDGVLREPLLAARDGVRHAFTTRHLSPEEELDLGDPRGRAPLEVERAWGRAAALVGAKPAQIVVLRQVHGADVARVAGATGPHTVAAVADAAVTTAEGVVLAIRVADCVPILVASDRGIGAIHAGWRGIVAGVVPAAIRALAELTGEPPSSFVAAIGPHAGVARYETGPEVPDRLVAAGLERDHVATIGPSGREHVDLGAAVKAQLRAAGVGQIGRIAACTIAAPWLHSHRRDGVAAGRQAALIVRAPVGA